MACIKFFASGIRFLMVASLVFILGSCTDRDLYANLDASGFIPNQKEILEAADWSVAETFEIDIRQNEFRPTIIHLLQGEPYIMVIENRDDVDHLFVAQEFFQTTAILKIVTESEEISGVNIIGLNLKPGEIKELHFVPVRDGWYDFEGGHGPGVFLTDTYLSPVSRGATVGMVGSFIVEE